jgi:hypothetical protein
VIILSEIVIKTQLVSEFPAVAPHLSTSASRVNPVASPQLLDQVIPSVSSTNSV